MRIRFWSSGLLMLFLASTVRGDTLNLESLIEEALRENPSLHTLRQRVVAAEARVPMAGALSDPMFRFESSNIPLSSFDLSSTPMSGNQLMVSQTLPFPGTRRARKDAARDLASSAALRAEDREAAVVNLVKQAYLSLAFLDRATSIAEQNESLLDEFVRIAQSKYGVGKGLQQDVLKAQVSLSSMRNRLIRLRANRRRAAARMNLVLNRRAESAVGAPEEVVMSSLGVDTSDFRARAFSSRPLLSSIEYTASMWRAKEREALRQRWPNFTFSFGYRQRAFMPFDPVEGSDFLSFGIGMNIPIYRGRKQEQMASSARANALAVDAQLSSAQAQVAHEIEVLAIAVSEHREQADLFRTSILPQARQSLDSALAGYQVDQVDFLTLLNNQVTLLQFEIDAYRHVIEHEKHLAELEAVSGVRTSGHSEP